jgi:hypothetical protein
MPRATYDPFAALALAALLAVLIPLEVHCAKLAHDTLGEVASGLWFLAVAFNLIPIVLLLLRRRAAALAAALLIGALLVPYQLVLERRLILLQEETAGIVSWVYREKLRTGDYPPDLSRYRFLQPELRRYIQEYRVGRDFSGFTLVYYVGTPSTSHWYSDGWFYYPD